MRKCKVKALKALANRFKPGFTNRQFRLLKRLYNKLPWTKRNLDERDTWKLFI